MTREAFALLRKNYGKRSKKYDTLTSRPHKLLYGRSHKTGGYGTARTRSADKLESLVEFEFVMKFTDFECDRDRRERINTDPTIWLFDPKGFGSRGQKLEKKAKKSLFSNKNHC
jgi:hypothetical protein